MTEASEVTKSNISQGADVEMDIVKDMAKRSWMLFLPPTIILGIIQGVESGLAVLVAALVILINLFIAAEIMRVCARISTTAIMGGALSGFVIRLIVVFIAALIVRNVSLIDFETWLLSVAIGHIALLAWETHYISFSLSHPGVKPGTRRNAETGEK